MRRTEFFCMILALAFAGQGIVLAQEASAVKSVSIAIPVKVTTYEELRRAISETKALSRKRVEQAVEQERVREAWEIGRLIDAHVLQHKERADYAEHVLVRLAGDLGMSRTELYYMLEFARAYPIVPLTGQLSWSHYRDLLSVNDPKERQVLAERTEKENWGRERLRDEVRNATKSGKAASAEVLTSEPGKSGTYRVILAKAGPYAGKLAIDLGFSCYYRPAGEFPFKEGEIIIVSQDSKGGYKLLAIGSGPESLLYTYDAYIYQVLDGDTVNAVVDLGFGFVTTQTLRLQGIDAPELSTADGMEAKAFLESVIANPVGVKQSQNDGIAASQFSVKNLRRIGTALDSNIEINDIQASSRRPAELLAMTTKPPVLIKTVKSDKYDRYLADVFLPLQSVKTSSEGTQPTGDEYEGVYVNQSLVDQGHAVIVEA